MPNDDLISMAGVAQLLGVSRNWISQLSGSGKLPGPDQTVPYRLWKSSTIERWARETGRWPEPSYDDDIVDSDTVDGIAPDRPAS